MNIALVILHADPTRGGAERYTIDLAAALATRGHRVSLLALDFGSERADDVTNVPLDARAATRVGRYVHFLDVLDEHLSRQPYNIVHAMLPVRRCDLYHPHAGLAADAVATGHLKHSGIAQAFSAIANRINRRRQRFATVERRLLESDRPPIVLCLSEYVKRTVRQYYPSLPDAKLATLFNAVDLTNFDPARRPDAGREVRQRFNIGDEKILALMIAQDFHRKGLREAIQALSLAHDKRIELVVVGNPPSEPYRRMAIQFGVAPHVHFVGRTDDAYAYYRAADFFVLPTRHDPCSLVVLESLAMGVPVISTIFNGACEIMTSGEHGFVLENPKDVEPLARAMDEMCDEARRRRMREACLSLRQRLSFDAHVHQLEEIYASTVRPPPSN
jgi:UDP-glucose:(heptosyl)LPS alpha-1,3-glucosyltransferase